ncbi:MAG: methylamine dehydrogenase accessory protein MauD [Steroidobacteraceae bacterium]
MNTVNALLISNVALWVLVVVLSITVLALVRQIGVLHERIAPVGALMLTKGLKIGDPAPVQSAQDLEGQELMIGGVRGDRRSTLLVFVSPTCPVCKSLLPALLSSRVGERDWLEIVLASDGDPEEQRRFVAKHALGPLSFVNSAPLGMAYQVSRLPFAALIDADGVLRARGIVNSREHLESLFEAKRLGVGSIQEYFEKAERERTA